jgi:hypothetical protein
MTKDNEYHRQVERHAGDEEPADGIEDNTGK